MSRARWAVSLFIAWHLAAIVLGALPPPGRLAPVQIRRPATDTVSERLVEALDTVAATLVSGEAALWRVLAPVRVPAAAYLRVAGLSQPWGMFSDPPKFDQYVRVRYFVRPPRGPLWAATELVMPAHHEDDVRLVRSFRDSSRDKAMTIAAENFLRRLARRAIGPETKTAALPDDLAPVARTFAHAFQRGRLRSGGGTLVRTEVWLGTAPTPAPGTPVDDTMREARRALLHRYYEGVVEQHVAVPPIPPYHALDREGDIEWILEYFEAS